MARWLLTFGILMVVFSLFWPWLHRLGLTRLPGDLLVDLVPGYRFHLPITTSLLISRGHRGDLEADHALSRGWPMREA